MLLASRDAEQLAAVGTFGFVGLVAFVSLVITVLYHVSLMRAIQACVPDNRTMAPGLVWLNLVPLLNLVWQFVTVVQVGGSLKREYADRGLRNGGSFGTPTGIVLYAIGLVGNVLANGFLLAAMETREETLAVIALVVYGLSGLVQFVLFIVYWVQIAG